MLAVYLKGNGKSLSREANSKDICLHSHLLQQTREQWSSLFISQKTPLLVSSSALHTILNVTSEHLCLLMYLSITNKTHKKQSCHSDCCKLFKHSLVPTKSPVLSLSKGHVPKMDINFIANTLGFFREWSLFTAGGPVEFRKLLALKMCPPPR